MKNPYSVLMRIFLALGLVRLSRSFCRLYCPVQDAKLAPEVASGDSPFLWGCGENSLFKDKLFDFVTVSHVLEHLVTPKKFLAEF